jgi:hypothetical protein
MRVVCINDSNKPAKVPQEEWIKKGAKYTVTKVAQMGFQKGKLGYKLKEVSLSEQSFPYEYYDSHRFVLLVKDKEIAKEEIVEEANLELV